MSTREPQAQAGEELVQQAKELADEAWAELYRLYFPRIYSYFLRRVWEPALAEELASEVFLSAVKGIGRYQSRGAPFSAWLFRIAHNLLVDHIRHESRREELESQGPSPSDPAGEEAFEQGLLRQELQEAMAHLTRDQRRVLVLRFIDDLSTQEVSRMLGKAEGAIKSIQHRGLAAMRGVLKGRWDG